MKVRIIAGLLGAVLLVALIFKGPFGLMVSIALACAGVAYLEYDRLFFNETSAPRQIRQISLVFLTMLAMRQSPESGWVALWISVVFLMVRHLLSSRNGEDFTRAIRDLGLNFVGYIYIVGLMGFLAPLAEAGPAGREYLFLLFFMVFMGDTLAYFVGSRFGRHTLAVHISPKKSVEGAAAALVGTTAAALGFAYFFPGKATTPEVAWKIVAFAPVVSVLAQLGDLFESMLKRSQARKDSGSFLPGHGGILDRLDGLAFAAPAFYFFILFFGGGA